MRIDQRRPHGLWDRVLVLRSLMPFDGVDDAALTLMAEHSRSRLFRAGEQVLRRGEPLRHIYWVLDGRLALTRAGKRETVARPHAVGLLSLLAADQAELEIEAEIDTLTLALPLDGLEEAFEGNFSLLRGVLRNVAIEVLVQRGNLPRVSDYVKSTLTGAYPERPITLVERVLQLRSTAFLTGCSVDALVALARALHEVRLPAGEVLWRVGDPATFWVRLDYGRVSCRSSTGESVEVEHGFVLGIMDALAQQPRVYEVRTETPVVAARVELRAFLAVVEAHVQLARYLVIGLARSVLDAADSEVVE